MGFVILNGYCQEVLHEPAPIRHPVKSEVAASHPHIHDNGMTTHFVCHADPAIHDPRAVAMVYEALGRCEHREYTDSQHCIEHTIENINGEIILHKS